MSQTKSMRNSSENSSWSWSNEQTGSSLYMRTICESRPYHPDQAAARPRHHRPQRKHHRVKAEPWSTQVEPGDKRAPLIAIGQLLQKCIDESNRDKLDRTGERLTALFNQAFLPGTPGYDLAIQALGLDHDTPITLQTFGTYSLSLTTGKNQIALVIPVQNSATGERLGKIVASYEAGKKKMAVEQKGSEYFRAANAIEGAFQNVMAKFGHARFDDAVKEHTNRAEKVTSASVPALAPFIDQLTQSYLVAMKEYGVADWQPEDICLLIYSNPDERGTVHYVELRSKSEVVLQIAVNPGTDRPRCLKIVHPTLGKTLFNWGAAE